MHPLTSHCSPSRPTTPPLKIDWSKVTDTNVCQFHDLISKNLPSFPQEILHCSSPDCTAHLKSIDSYTQSFISILDTCSLLCFPTFIPSSASSPKVPGWKDTGTDKLREMSIFWHHVWVEAGYPCSGVLFNIKPNAKKRFKYAVRRLKRRRDYLVREKLASAFSTRDKNRF